MSRYRSSRYVDPGIERARQHIAEAQALSAELGGTDEDVKQYFFTLSPEKLSLVLDAYQRKHGLERRVYAEQTLPRWRSGRVHMSGMVASRLYSLLPPLMPLEAKF